MPWDSAVLQRLAGTEELEISSYRQDGSQRPWTTIWVVRVGDDLYIRSVFGAEGAWYRNAMRRGTGRVRAVGVEAEVTLTHVDDASTVAEVGDAFRLKYAAQPSALAPILTPSAADTTVRVDPRMV